MAAIPANGQVPTLGGWPADRPWVAGMYDFFLGGTANSAVDRAAASRVMEVLPEVKETAWSNRGFLQRVVTTMARDLGIRQFIDLGAGLPTQRHVHEVARETCQECQVVYVDNDPRVVERGMAMLGTDPQTTVIQADIRDDERVISHPQLTRLIDFRRPVGLLLVAAVQWIPRGDDPHGLISRYLGRLASGSYFAMTIPTGDKMSDQRRQALKQVYGGMTTAGASHTRAEAERFFEGLEILSPYAGAPAEVTYAGLWGAEDPELADDEGCRWVYGAVARKP